MKTFTQLATAALVACLPIAAAAQDLSSGALKKGLEISQQNGVMGTMLKWQETAAPKFKSAPQYDPHKRMLEKMGVEKKNQYTTFSTEYDFYGGAIDKGNNIPMASLTDAGGNTYITGGSSNTSQPAGDFFTIKVSPGGNILWEKREPAVMYAVEYGMEMAFDSAGDLVVTGIKWNGTDVDIRVIKYSAATGEKAWEKIYDGGESGLDVPSAITADTHGNTYVTGISWSGETVDFITLKYDSAGNQVWEAREEDGEWNEPFAIAVDGNDNVIVAGWNPNTEGWANYHTVKYDSSGVEQWAQSYNYPSTDPENPMDVTNSLAYAVTTDEDGNVYVTGEFDTFLSRIGTIKYNAAGEQQWIQTYKVDGARTEAYSIAVKGDVLYVSGNHRAGFAGDGDGNVLISYDLDGNENWIAVTNDLIDAYDPVMLFDSEDNIVVAVQGTFINQEDGSDTAVWATKFSPDGEEISEANYIASGATGTESIMALAGAGLDSDDNIYFGINKFYTAEGNVYEVARSGFAATAPDVDWNTFYSNLGTPGAGMLYAFKDNNGGTISTGNYYSWDGEMLNSNWFVVKHDAEGAIAWQKVYNAENGNAANGIIGRADQDGNVYVILLPDFGETAITVKKLSPAGDETWESEVTLQPGAQMYVAEAGPDGSFYLGGTGYETETAENPSFIAIKLDSAGNIVWDSYIASANEGDNLYGINSGKVADDGSFILAGAAGTGGMMSQDVDMAVVKVNNDGTTAWVTPVSVEGYNTEGFDMLIATDGSIYINGFGTDTETFYEDTVVAKVNADGTFAWANTFGAADKNERSYTIREYSTGDVAVVGYSLALNGEINNTILKYNPAGELLWSYASELMRYYNSFHLDGSDKAYVMNQEIIDVFPAMSYSGYFTRPTLVTVEADGTGDELFFIGPEYAQFYGEEIVAHEDDRLLLSGSLNNQNFFEGVYFFETEHDGTAGIGDHGNVPNNANRLGQNYPNPANGITEIPFHLTDGGKATLTLYDVQGRPIREIANDTFSVGDNTVQFDATGLSEGIYFYQITAGKFKQARKMVVSKQ